MHWLSRLRRVLPALVLGMATLVGGCVVYPDYPGYGRHHGPYYGGGYGPGWHGRW